MGKIQFFTYLRGSEIMMQSSSFEKIENVRKFSSLKKPENFNKHTLGAFSNSGEVKVNKKIFFHQYDPALIRKNSKSLSKIPVNYFKTYNESKPIKNQPIRALYL